MWNQYTVYRRLVNVLSSVYCAGTIDVTRALMALRVGSFIKACQNVAFDKGIDNQLRKPPFMVATAIVTIHF